MSRNYLIQTSNFY